MSTTPAGWTRLAFVALLALGGCAAEEPADEPTVASTTTLSPESTTSSLITADCVAVSPAYESSIGVSGLKASSSARQTTNGRPIWYLASPKGGLWATTGDPAGEGGGLMNPLNESARQETEAGSEMPEDPPIFGGINEQDAIDSGVRDCP